MIYLTLQLSFMTSYKDIYQGVKPLFDVGSFYISYLNYLTVFAVISYALRLFFKITFFQYYYLQFFINNIFINLNIFYNL